MAQISKKFNPVEADKIFTEAIKWEARTSKLSEVFSVPDPRRMTLLPAKPNATTPAQQPTEAQLAEAEATLSRLAGIKHAHKVMGSRWRSTVSNRCSTRAAVDSYAIEPTHTQVPTQVHQLPATSNMEYGFWAGSMPDELRDDPMFVHYSSHSDVSQAPAGVFSCALTLLARSDAASSSLTLQVTLYASNYVQLTGRSPFRRPGGSGAAAASGK
jgi:hypothetical protein